jgi:hypothetical protein
MKHPAHDQNQGALGREASKLVGGRGLGDMEAIRPMDAIAIVPGSGIGLGSKLPMIARVAPVFGENYGGPAGPAQRALARISYRVLKWTTTRRKANEEDYEGGAFHNPILERSRHPYGRALLDSSSRERESLVEGGIR